MNNTEVLITIFISAVITFGLRALPFIIFKGDKKMPKSLEQLVGMLPMVIMAVLIVYCLKDVGSDFTSGISQIVAVIVVFISYKLKHNTLLSIVLGTGTNMLLLYLL